MVLSEVFYTFVISSSVALIAKISTLCFKSKCKEVNLCCLKVIRDVETEEKETEFLQNAKPNNNSPTGSDDKTSV